MPLHDRLRAEVAPALGYLLSVKKIHRLRQLRPIYLAFIVYSFLAGAAGAGERLSINTTSSPPHSQPDLSGFQDLLVIEAFKRIGKEVTIQFLPGERSLMNLNSGIDDATAVRILGIENNYPNVVRVPEALVQWEFAGFTKLKNLHITSFKDLKPYSVAYIRGWQIFEDNVTQARAITIVTKPSALFRLLESGRADIVLYEKWAGLQAVSDLGSPDIRRLRAPLAIRDMYLYLHRKHEALVEGLAGAIRRMRADGTYDHFYQRALAPIDG